MSQTRVPWQTLSTQVLQAVIEDFVTREGTDYGVRDLTLKDKVEQVLNQLKNEQAVIVFETESETCSIMLADEIPPEA
ncbi:MAG: YheU family protein [Pseudomonadales bacterium]|nr:YheU family protein [Pseudomonadales bacterium]